MSLSAAERSVTSDELVDNLLASGATRRETAAALSFTDARLESTLRVDEASDPVDVWLLRDHLETAVRARGGRPVAYTVLTEASRASAAGWFGVASRPIID